MRNMRKRCHNIYQFGEIKIERLIKKEEDGGGKKRERKKERRKNERKGKRMFYKIGLI